MTLAKLKGWLRRIATVEGREKTADSPDTPDQKVRVEAERSRPVGQTPGHPKAVSGKPRPPARKPTAVQPAAPKIRTPRTTRQGIPILNPDEDLAHHFLARADVQEEVPSENPPGCDAPEAPEGKGHPGPVVAQRQAGKGRGKRPYRNRLGIRQLDAQRDLSDYFLSAASEKSASARPPALKTEGRAPTKAGRRPKIAAATDRHGIPRLDDQTDLRQFFEAALEDQAIAEDQELGEVFRASLDHDAHRLMKKKAGGFFAPRRLSLKEKLRRYPAPQAQLDLHGDTALIAQQRADSFLRRAGAAGTLTVRIIVGKGLHSEDGAVLPDVIEDLLVALKRDGHVLTFRWDKGLKRKSGAVIVYLESPLH